VAPFRISNQLPYIDFGNEDSIIDWTAESGWFTYIAVISLTTSSLLLGGLAAAAVPVLLHLLMQGKPKEIEFPAVMFIVQKIETYRRNYRLKYILLLLLRILLFALLGLALARPMLKLSDGIPFFSFFSRNQEGFVSHLVSSLGSQDAPIAVAIVVDTSLRMNYVSENKTRLEVAQEFASWILRQVPQNSSIAILGCEPESAVFQIDERAAEDKISRLRITPFGRPVGEVVQGAAALLLESPHEQRELYILSDLSLPGWDVPVSTDLLQRYGGEGGLFLVDVGVKEPQNSSIRGFSLIPEAPMANSSLRFEVQVAHSGPATTKTVELILIGNAHDPNAETVRMSRTVNFPGGESQQSFPMELTGFDPGVQQGKLRFSTSDALPMDDQCWFTLAVQPPQKILIFAQPPVRDSAIFLQQALELIPFAVETKPMSELSGTTATELKEYQAVVLLDPSPLLPTVWKKLADYASAGYGVATFLGSKALDSHATPSFNDPQATEVLGAKLVRQARNLEGELWMLPGVSPIFTPFRSHAPLERFPWDALPIFRYWELDELSHRADIAASYSDNRPAIVTQTQGRGRTVLVTTPISDSPNAVTIWNTLPQGETAWMFLLLAEGIGKHLVGMGNQKFNFTIGEPVVLRPEMTTLPTSCWLGTPLGKSERLTPDPIRREITIQSTTEPGNYTVRSGGVGQAALDMGFSANIPDGATVLQKVDATMLDRHFGKDNYQVVRTPQEIEMGIARRRIGQEMYAAIMFLLACLFATEYIFANRIYKSS